MSIIAKTAMQYTLLNTLRWATLAIWAIWLILYWGAGVGLIANFARSFRISSFFYDRFFILGLVILSNVILWSGFFLLRGKITIHASPFPFLVLTGAFLTLIGAAGTFWCRRQMRESWSAHTALLENHRLVDDGPYGMVRHPIYAFACLMVVGTTLVFPLWWNFFAGAGMIALYVFKLQFEENMLAGELPGYAEYRQRVRYRLVPYLW